MAGKQKILVVDDDVNIAELISLYLTKEGYEVQKVHDGKKGVDSFSTFAPHLVVLDLMLPEMDGYDVCKEIRKRSNIPIIMLTAKGETFDKVLGLELGADDYVVKPFDPKELVARVKAVLRRFEPKEDQEKQIVLPNMTISISNYTVRYNGEQIDMPPKELELLYYLASHKNQVFTREQLLNQIWGYEYIGDTRTVDVHIKRIREKFKNENEWAIKTVWGVGYKFEVK